MPEGRSDTMPEGIPRSETPRNGDPGVSDSTEDGRIVLPRGMSAYFLITNRIDQTGARHANAREGLEIA